jgi:hypothetical protein
MNIGNEIDYVCDEKRQVISHIHVKDMQGQVIDYYAQDSTLSKDRSPKLPTSYGPRRLPQPSNPYLHSADQAVDQALLAAD